ncbi:MAG: peptidase M48 [Spirochaetaceae bacterium]|nr:MAG: peptidase M48 [Spirochaetaceae bacterium]
MNRSTRIARIAMITIATAALVVSCAGLSGALGSALAVGEGLGVSGSGARLALAGVRTLSEVVDAANSPFTPEQEYYIGRSVAATILKQYPAYTAARPNRYINSLGQVLALASDRPQLYHGYTFLILDTDEINAFATPGGHIFISRGMLRLTTSEDEVAAVLAHEIAHVVHRHGLGSIRSARVIGALQQGTLDMLDEVSGAQLREVTEIFGETTSEILDTLITRGYSGASEREADASAVEILKRVGYDPHAIVRVLERMDAAQQAEYEGSREPVGFSKTHPRPQSRVNGLKASALRNVEPESRIRTDVADRRFREALSGI